MSMTVDEGLKKLAAFANRLPADVVKPGQFSRGERRVSNLFPYQAGGARLAVQGLDHEIGNRVSLRYSVQKRCLALKRGQLRMGT